jgi:hypothetical protein
VRAAVPGRKELITDVVERGTATIVYGRVPVLVLPVVQKPLARPSALQCELFRSFPHRERGRKVVSVHDALETEHGLERLRISRVVLLKNGIDRLDGGRERGHAGLVSSESDSVHVLPHVDDRLGHAYEVSASFPITYT